MIFFRAYKRKIAFSILIGLVSNTWIGTVQSFAVPLAIPAINYAQIALPVIMAIIHSAKRDEQDSFFTSFVKKYQVPQEVPQISTQFISQTSSIAAIMDAFDTMVTEQAAHLPQPSCATTSQGGTQAHSAQQQITTKKLSTTKKDFQEIVNKISLEEQKGILARF